MRDVITDLAPKMGLDSVPQIEPKTLKALGDYPWPGNIRELCNVLERALILCDKKRITQGDLILKSKLKWKEAPQKWSITFGFPGYMASGIDVTHIAGKSIIAAIRHRQLGAIDWGLGLAMVGGTTMGVELGVRLLVYTKTLGLSGFILLAACVAIPVGAFLRRVYLLTAQQYGVLNFFAVVFTPGEMVFLCLFILTLVLWAVR